MSYNRCVRMTAKGQLQICLTQSHDQIKVFPFYTDDDLHCVQMSTQTFGADVLEHGGQRKPV